VSEERLQEIKDSLNAQYEIAKSDNKYQSVYVVLDEEQELIEEIERLNNIIKTKDEGFKASIEELTDYANRIDKALEYIKEYLYINEETGEYCLTHTFDSSNLYELMKILKEKNK